MRLSIGIQGTSWLRTVTNMFCSCSTLLCLRLCSSALGTTPGSAVRNTAVPSTRAGGLMNTEPRKDFRSIASACCASPMRRRPSFQVTISVNTAPPIRSGNQPPSNSLSRFEAKNRKSTTKKIAVEAMHSASGSFHA
ncbi:hypothetical protein D3C87_780350 [compost metagenome]